MARSPARSLAQHWATPFLPRPLRLGLDFRVPPRRVLRGHCDVMGVPSGRGTEGPCERLRAVQARPARSPRPSTRGCPQGNRTLPWPCVRTGASGAVAILSQHPRIERVHYPGLSNDPGYRLASTQMAAAGGMLSFIVPGGRPEALDVAARVRLFTRATSLGGPQSLIEHRASIEGPHTRASEGLLRVSVGLEHPEDLINDLEQALQTDKGRSTIYRAHSI